jgi:two-component system chemotaxis response regulator CheY
MAVIVLAEDDVHILRVVSIWLKQNRHTVLEARNGREALSLVLEHRPDVLVADVNMPVMDGITLVRTCADQALPRMGTIVLTSRCDQREIHANLQGMNVVLHPKPFSPSRLVGDVEKLIAGVQTGAARKVDTEGASRNESDHGD